jgi:nitrogen fixation/metabolism regulation signal transduction histidine kinase
MANTYARELYHEVIRLLSPLAASAERLREKLLAEQHLPATLMDEADGIGRRVRRLRMFVDVTGAYTA